MRTRTSIICTIGPACRDYGTLLQLIDAGMRVARLNFSHGDHETHAQTIADLKRARKEAGRPLAIMLDTKGPEVRTGMMQGGAIEVTTGQHLRLLAKECEGTVDGISVSPGFVLKNLEVGARVLFDDGYVASHVVEAGTDVVVVEIENNGKIASKKSLNFPSTSLDLPAMTDQDVEDIRFGCQQGVDLIAASFIRSAEHVLAIKRLLAEENAPFTPVFAKIENREGVENFDGIVQVADGILVARGDLGVEMPLSQVPSLQKMMIRKCYLAGKPSVTATQMLESMVNNPRPTRAEASDVANAIYDSTSAVMLSGETASGKYPVEAVKMMKSIISEAEHDFDYRGFFNQHMQLVYHDVPSAVTLASVKTAYSSGAKAIFACTSSGSTARMISRLRPEMPIIAVTPIERIYHQLAFNWGVVPVFHPSCEGVEDAVQVGSDFALKEGYVNYGDLAVVTGGQPFGVAGTTNMMRLENIGDVLVRAHTGLGEAVFGKARMVFSPGDRKPYDVKDGILVITKCDDSYLPLLKQAAGIILQNHIDDLDSENYVMLVSKTLDIPAVIRADSACAVLKEGQMITMDPASGLVYAGVQMPE